MERDSRLLLNDYHFLRAELRGSLRLTGGGHIQRRGSDHLAGTEVKRENLHDACAIAFLGVDTDRSGHITPAEFETLLLRLLGPNTTKETRRRIEYLFQVLNNSKGDMAKGITLAMFVNFVSGGDDDEHEEAPAAAESPAPVQLAAAAAAAPAPAPVVPKIQLAKRDAPPPPVLKNGPSKRNSAAPKPGAKGAKKAVLAPASLH